MTHGTLIERIKYVTKPKSALFGLITWEELVSTKSLGNELHIKTTTEKLFVNGKEISLGDIKPRKERG